MMLKVLKIPAGKVWQVFLIKRWNTSLWNSHEYILNSST